jgi:hypothetical protein
METLGSVSHCVNCLYFEDSWEPMISAQDVRAAEAALAESGENKAEIYRLPSAVATLGLDQRTAPGTKTTIFKHAKRSCR